MFTETRNLTKYNDVHEYFRVWCLGNISDPYSESIYIFKIGNGYFVYKIVNI